MSIERTIYTNVRYVRMCVQRMFVLLSGCLSNCLCKAIHETSNEPSLIMLMFDWPHTLESFGNIYYMPQLQNAFNIIEINMAQTLVMSGCERHIYNLHSTWNRNHAFFFANVYTRDRITEKELHIQFEILFSIANISLTVKCRCLCTREYIYSIDTGVRQKYSARNFARQCHLPNLWPNSVASISSRSVHLCHVCYTCTLRWCHRAAHQLIILTAKHTYL